jgi:hypothetical protein
LIRLNRYVEQELPMSALPIKDPSAVAPVVMSLAGVGLVLAHVAYHGGIVHHPDEGAAAHLWQLLMAGQVPVIAFFAVKWLPRAPRRAAWVLALQAAAALASFAAVFFLT